MTQKTGFGDEPLSRVRNMPVRISYPKTSSFLTHPATEEISQKSRGLVKRICRIKETYSAVIDCVLWSCLSYEKLMTVEFGTS
jgi:hypothetical protein